MVTAEELTVAIKSEGVSDTREDVEAVGESMEQTAEESGDAAEELTGFSEDIAGAASAAVAGLALITGGLLSQIPILGEFAAGLGAILSAIGLQVDQLIRDLGGGGLTQVLFDIANGIMNLEGTAADLAGVLGVVLTAVTGAAAGLAAWAIKAKGVMGAASALGGALKTVGSVLAGIVGGISATTAALALAVAAVVGFAAAYLTNFRGVRDTTNRIVGQIKKFVVNGFKTFTKNAIKKLKKFGNKIKSKLSSVASTVSDWASGVADDALDWGKNIVQGLINGIESQIGRVKDLINDLRDIADSVDLDLPSLGDIDFPSFGGINSTSPDASGASGIAGGTPGGRGRPIARTANGQGVSLDGRQLSESTGRYRSDPSRRRGL